MLALRPKQMDFRTSWDKLQNCVRQCLMLQKVDRDVWNNSFSDIYDLCVAVPEPYNEKLYLETQRCLEDHVRQLYSEVRCYSDVDLLLAYNERWNVYYRGSEIIQNLFSYLNRQYLRMKKFSDADLNYGNIQLPTTQTVYLEIGELALVTWRREMIMPLEDALITQLLSAIAADRRNETVVAQQVVKGVIQSFVDVGQYGTRDQLVLYRDMFESRFLEDTSKHYQAEACSLLADLSISKYMELVTQKIKDEDMRAERFLDPSSYEKVRGMCQSVMVAKHQDKLHAVSRDFVQREQRDDLLNMYDLLKPIQSGLQVLVKQFELYVKKLGYDAVQNLTGDTIHTQFVENILSVHKKFSEFVSMVFRGDQEFWGAMDKALLSAVNYKEESRGPPKASELVAKYCDTLLRKSAKGLSETEVDNKLTMAITIFRYIDDKDVFQKFYSRMLTNRLIHGLSVSMDAEEQMINKLKQACGYEFTSKLQRMFTDISVSKGLTENFYTYLTNESKELNVPVNILVLQAGSWPLSAPGQQGTSAPAPFAVPFDLQQATTFFEEFYTKQFNGRKLSWLFNLATVDVRLGYTEKAYVVTMSVQQFTVMQCFAQQDSVTLETIGQDTQLGGDSLSKIMRTLVDSQLLASDATPSTYSPSTSFNLNQSFTSKRLKFKIIVPPVQKQAEKESEQVNTTIQQDRKYFLECTIVRVMKTRKVLKHNALIDEVIRQSKSRFVPDVAFIKKVIESLIDKQYLQRTDQNDEYAYLA